MPEITNTALALQKASEWHSITLTKRTFNFDRFTTINKGGYFSLRRCWRIDNSPNAYLVSFYNSYNNAAAKGSLDYHSRISTYLGSFVQFDINVPDTIIQPFTLAERLMDLLFHENIHLNNHPVFNKKYILHSTDKTLIVQILTDELINEIGSYDGLNIEIRNNTCVIYFLSPVKESDGPILVSIAKKMTELNQYFAQPAPLNPPST